MFGEREREIERERERRLFKRCRNLHAGHCVARVQAVKAVLGPTCRHCVAGCRLFKRCLNLPARHCVAGVQAV